MTEYRNIMARLSIKRERDGQKTCCKIWFSVIYVLQDKFLSLLGLRVKTRYIVRYKSSIWNIPVAFSVPFRSSSPESVHNLCYLAFAQTRNTLNPTWAIDFSHVSLWVLPMAARGSVYKVKKEIKHSFEEKQKKNLKTAIFYK